MKQSLIYGLNETKFPVIVARVKNKHLCFIIDTRITCSLIDSNVVEYSKETLGMNRKYKSLK